MFPTDEREGPVQPYPLGKPYLREEMYPMHQTIEWIDVFIE